jgi:hypothetical protein
MSSNKRGPDVLQLKCPGGVYVIVERAIQQLALQPSPQPESSLPLIGQTSHLTVLSVMLSSYYLTLQIEKAARQPKRSKERNSEGVNELPC